MADRADDAAEAELIETVLLRLYAEEQGFHADCVSTIPPEVLVPVMPASGEVLTGLLAEQRGARVRVHVPRRGAKAALLGTVARNAAEALTAHKTRRAADLSTRGRALAELQEALGLASAPLRIEGFDISHLMPTSFSRSCINLDTYITNS